MISDVFVCCGYFRCGGFIFFAVISAWYYVCAVCIMMCLETTRMGGVNSPADSVAAHHS